MTLSAIHHQAAANADGSGIALAPLFEFARVLIGESESRLQAARRVAAENRLAILRATSASLAGAFEDPGDDGPSGGGARAAGDRRRVKLRFSSSMPGG